MTIISSENSSSPLKNDQEPAIRIENISKSYDYVPVLSDVSFEVNKGETIAIIGPSGSGKSTLLRTINGLEKVDDGLITVNGEVIGYRRDGRRLYELSAKEILKQRSKIGFVFQNFNLFPHLTVLENVIEAPLSAQRRPRKQVTDEAQLLLERVGVLDKASSYPRQLSGGQQQRVAIARSLALKPEIILFDEPTSALDPELVSEVLEVIREVATSGVTAVIVTHEIGFAREISDRVVFLDQGEVVEAGPTTTVLQNPQNERTKLFLSKVLS